MKKIVRPLLALAIAVGGVISPMTSAAQAEQSGVYMWLRYYSEDTHVNQVGVYIVYCDWSDYFSGGISEHSLVDYYQC